MHMHISKQHVANLFWDDMQTGEVTICSGCKINLLQLTDDYCLIDHLLLAVWPPSTIILYSRHMLSADAFLGSQLVFLQRDTSQCTVLAVSQKTRKEISNFVGNSPSINVTNDHSLHIEELPSALERYSKHSRNNHML